MDDLTERKFEKIYGEYVKLVYFIISKYVDDTSDREELTNDVFVDFYVRMEDVENVKYYLTTTAKNKAINHLTRRKTPDTVLDENAAVKEEVKGDGGYADTVEDMKNVLNDLEIDIIIEHAVFGKTFDKLSKENGMPLKTVYSLYKRAIKKYRRYKGV